MRMAGVIDQNQSLSIFLKWRSSRNDDQPANSRGDLVWVANAPSRAAVGALAERATGTDRILQRGRRKQHAGRVRSPVRNQLRRAYPYIDRKPRDDHCAHSSKAATSPRSAASASPAK